MKKYSVSTIIVLFILHLVLVSTVFFVLYPVAFTVGAAFTKTNSLAATSISPIPKEPSLYQFKRLLTPADKIVAGTTDVRGTNYVKWYGNTLKIAALNVLFSLAVCVTAAYVFSRFRFPLRKPLMASMIVLQMFPSFIGMIATYVLLWKINGLNTHWGLLLVYAAGSIPMNVWLMKGYFDTVPKSIEEAARVDGAGSFTTYVKIVLPMVKPMIMFLALTSFTGPWMDFIFPRLILRSDEKKTLALGLFELINGRANDNFTMFAAGALLVAVPFAVLFMAGQRFLLKSLAGDAVKE
ncbi:MAG: sugar ABC transporter permease [Treponema sp.]